MSLKFCLVFCLVQFFSFTNANEETIPFSSFVPMPEYSFKTDEIVNVPVSVHNYLKNDFYVIISLGNRDDKYEIIEFDNNVVSGPILAKRALLPSKQTVTVFFPIRLKAIGNIKLKFNVTSLDHFEEIHKTINVVPGGIIQYENRAFFINLKNKTEQKFSFELELPESMFPNSDQVVVGVSGDILGPVFNNVDNLARLPTGCGEQTMSSLWTNYLIIKYLMNSNRLTPSMEAKLRYNLQTGYQHMLNYRHTDGSFSSFGPSKAKEKPRNGSTWLTANVARVLPQIKEFVNVNETIVEEGFAYLSKQQADNGEFIENGNYFYASQENNISVTIAAVLAFQENPAYADKYSRVKAEGLDYLAQAVEKSKSIHTLSLATYTLNKANHAAAAKKGIGRLAMIKLAEYNKDGNKLPQKHFVRGLWNSLFTHDVESTSYNLLTLLDLNSTTVDHVVPIVKWLIAQRNSLGGFVPAQDTVIGLTALIKFAEFANYKPAKIDVDIVSNDKNETIILTADNEIFYQTVEMPPKTRLIQFVAKGSGSALVQVAYQYNTFANYESSFSIKPKNTVKTNTSFERSWCVNYEGDKEFSNMALLEISTPSGYTITRKCLNEINELERVGKTKLKNFGATLIVYFDRLYKNDEICLTVEAVRTLKVAMQMPHLVRLYDYYDTNRNASAYYDMSLELCDICVTDDECSKCK